MRTTFTQGANVRPAVSSCQLSSRCLARVDVREPLGQHTTIAEQEAGAHADASSVDDRLNELEADARKMRQSHNRYKWTNRWLHYLLGGGISVFAAAAAVTALEEARPGITAILAGAASVLSAIQLFLRPGERTAFHLLQEIAYDELAKEAGDTRARRPEAAAAEQALESLRAKYYTARRKAAEGSPQ
jgi:hypothetical protein